MREIGLSTERPRLLSAAAWMFAICLAALQAHFFLVGFRLTGDDVLFENIILHGKIAEFITQTANEQARIGQYILVPLLLVGSHFSSSIFFRVFYVALWYIDVLLFSTWLSQLARAPIALIVFVSIVVLQPMIGYHMPPVGYPLELSVPLLVVLATRLLLAPDAAVISQKRRMKCWLVSRMAWVIYAGAVLSSEYIIIFASCIVLMEASTANIQSKSRNVIGTLRLYRGDLWIILFVYMAYLIFRWSHLSRYDGATLDGLSNHRNLLFTFAMHIASGTWLPFADTSALTRGAVVGSTFSVAFCAGAIFLQWRTKPLEATPKTQKLWRLSGLPLLGVVALTLPVVAASKQQHWCTVDHNCSYLDSRLSLLMLVAAVTLATLPLLRFEKAFRWISVCVFFVLTISAAACYAIGREQATGMHIASSGWTRARMIACSPGVDATSASSFIDPQHFIPMHSFMNRDAFWQSYMSRIAKGGDCLHQVAVSKVYRTSTLALGEAAQIRLGGSGLPLLVSGWSYPEVGGVWSVGSSAIIELQVPASNKAVIVALQLISYAPAAGQSQPVSVLVDGQEAAQWMVASDVAKPYTFIVPAATLHTGGKLRIRLDIAHPISPLQRNESADPRELGVLLSSLQLQPMTSPQ
ncbi:hypothetical protein ACPPVV_01525 [Rhodanobacter sp. Col0626]|uniref:hypothetical protein n=1 Tax=Rhodanobacter sp. Col0626 TaxID=3415679 RepID=UPI003CE9D92F